MRTLRRSAALVLALWALLAAAGCGGEERASPPALPAGLAESLASRSDSVAARLDSGDGCGARAEAEALQAQAIAAVNDGRVPAPYQEELVASVNELVASIACTPPPAEEDDEDEDGDDGPGNGKGKGRKGGRS